MLLLEIEFTVGAYGYVSACKNLDIAKGHHVHDLCKLRSISSFNIEPHPAP